MSLLDAARRLLQEPEGYECGFCGAIRTKHTGLPPQPHSEGCPLLAASGIVAALEAIDGLMQQFADPENWHLDCGASFTLLDLLTLGELYIGREAPDWFVHPMPHNFQDVARHRDLLATLRGEVVPSDHHGIDTSGPMTRY